MTNEFDVMDEPRTIRIGFGCIVTDIALTLLVVAPFFVILGVAVNEHTNTQIECNAQKLSVE